MNESLIVDRIVSRMATEVRTSGAGMSDSAFRSKVYRIMQKIARRYGGTASGMVAAGDLADGTRWSATIFRQNASNGEVAGRLDLTVQKPGSAPIKMSEFWDWDKMFEKAGIPIVNPSTRMASSQLKASQGQVIATNETWFSWDESSHGYKAYVSLDGEDLYFELESEDVGDFSKRPPKTIFDGRIGTLSRPDYSKINSLLHQYHMESRRGGYNWSKRWRTPKGHELLLADIIDSHMIGSDPASKLLDFDSPNFIGDLKNGLKAHTVQVDKVRNDTILISLYWMVDSERRMKELGPKFSTDFTKVTIQLVKSGRGVNVQFFKWTTSYKMMRKDRKPPSKHGFTTTKEIIKFINTYYMPKDEYVYEVAASRIASELLSVANMLVASDAVRCS